MSQGPGRKQVVHRLEFIMPGGHERRDLVQPVGRGLRSDSLEAGQAQL